MRKNYIVVILGLICFIFFSWGAFELWDYRDGPCVIVRPIKELVFGDIRFSYEAYTLYYPGIYEHSGRSCLCPVRVTEAEYERQMYKDEK